MKKESEAFIKNLFNYINKRGKFVVMDSNSRIFEKISKDENDYELALCEVAKEICADNNIRLILITGGSCSGKTTTTKKLAALINSIGRHTHTISLDDFYRNTEDSVYNPDGTRDIESINSLEIGLIKKCLCDLTEGRTAQIPRFDFLTQHRTDNYEQIVLEGTEVAIIEGLHALNPQLFKNESCKSDTKRNQIAYKIFLHATDEKSGDPRFIRRLVRDYNYRGATARDTFNQWDIVKRNEPEFIDQFAKTANIQLNTYFPYERGVLAGPAVEILSELPAVSRNFWKAKKLIEELSHEEQIPATFVPKNSMLQEFIKIK